MTILDHAHFLPLLVLFLGATWAGAQNQLAGGGSFITLPSLILTGMDARAANITSAVALFPGQVTGGWIGRRNASGTRRLSLAALVVISLVGGAVGAALLLLTPSTVFAKMVPWLVLFATVAFAWGSFGRKPQGSDGEASGLGALPAGAIQFAIAVYGGYFGGGIGFLMMAALALSHMPVRAAAATKNVLAGVMNFTAVLIFLFSGQVYWLQAAIACIGALIGSVIGARLIHAVPERALRIGIVVLGLVLTVGLFLRA